MIKNKKVLGIIAEYDPFHKGHYLHLQSAIKESGADYVCIIQSGPFMQRGTLSMFSPHDRAYMAMLNGADAVFEMPLYFALSDAYRFALGGVSILDGFGFVDYIAFGCEDSNIELLSEIAGFLDSEDIFKYTKPYLKTGESYATAQGNAILDAFGKYAYDIFKKSNNILAICYIRVLKYLKSNIKPVAIKRSGFHLNNKIDNESPSAGAIREQIKNGNIHNAIKCIPNNSVDYFLNILLENKINRNDFPSEHFMIKALNSDSKDFEQIPGVSEGIENRIINAVKESDNVNNVISKIKSRRYILPRIKRALSYYILGINKNTLEENALPKYCKLLAKSIKGEDIISSAKFKIIKRPQDIVGNEYDLDMLAYNIWSASAQYPNYKVFRIMKG